MALHQLLALYADRRLQGARAARRRHGFAAQLVAAAERLLAQSGCPKINLQVRTSNPEVITFYRRIGYVFDDVVSLGKRLEKDDI